MGYDVRVRELEARPVLGIRDRVAADGIAEAIGEFLTEVWNRIEALGASAAGPPFTRYHEIDGEEVLLEAGLPVYEPLPGAGRVEAGELPGGEAISTDHFGPYEDLPAAGEALDAWVREHDRRAAGPNWEFYWTDPGTESDPRKWRTEVIKPLAGGGGGGMKAEQAAATFGALRDILARHAPRLDVERNDPDAYVLNAGYSEKWDRVIFFGSAEIKKRYVSYHLFPVYMFPDLLEDLSPELEKRMQGKSCFNFTTIADGQREELARLTERGFGRFESEGLV